jgi:glycosyltransferase involved in cell wall biosynthesis
LPHNEASAHRLGDEQPLVSIITPSFNQGAFLAAAIDSVLGQEYPYIEYLVVDGGSSDASLDVLRSYGARLRWLSEPDGGQADAINKGVALTRGELVAWLNADDVYAPGAIARMVAGLRSYPRAALAYGQAEFIDQAGREIGPCPQVQPFSLDRLIHYLDFIVQPATLFRRDALLAVGGLDAGLHYCLDYDLWIRLALRYPVVYLPAVLAQARVYPATKTASGGMARLDEIERMIRRYGRRRLPMLFYGEMIRACWAAACQALAKCDWRRSAALARRGLEYGGALGLRKVGART